MRTGEDRKTGAAAPSAQSAESPGSPGSSVRRQDATGFRAAPYLKLLYEEGRGVQLGHFAQAGDDGNTAERGKSPAAGFSIVEALIAASLLLIIAIGVLPLFTRSILNNVSGNESILISNFGKSRLERRLQVPFSSTDLTVAAGTTVNTTYDWWGDGATTSHPYKYGGQFEKWWPSSPLTNAAPPTDADQGHLLWQRKTEVREYNISNLTAPVDGGTDPQFVHLKEITVTLIRPPQTGGGLNLNLLSPGKTVVLRVMRAD